MGGGGAGKRKCQGAQRSGHRVEGSAVTALLDGHLRYVL